MGMWMNIAPADITARFRPLTPEETAIVQEIITDAQDMVTAALEDAGWDAAPVDDRRERAFVRAVAYAVIRIFQNPDGILTETIDGYTYRRDSAVSTGRLYIHPDDFAALKPAGVRRRRGAFTITLS